MNTLQKSALGQRQRGIVLLSCLVLLILILSLLRFMMSSSHVQERRASIETEMFNAKERSLSALNKAEESIICFGGGCDASDSQVRKQVHESWSKWLLGDSSVGTPPNGFVAYRNIKSLSGANDCTHIWKCTTWRLSGGSATNSADVFTPVKLNQDGDPIVGAGSPTMEYIVEVFSGAELGLDEQDTTPGDISTLIFRVTAMGYGEIGAAANAGAQETKHLMQADYVFSKEE